MSYVVVFETDSGGLELAYGPYDTYDNAETALQEKLVDIYNNDLPDYELEKYPTFEDFMEYYEDQDNESYTVVRLKEMIT